MDNFTGENIMSCNEFALRTGDIQEIFCFNSYNISEAWEYTPERMVDCIMYNESFGTCFPKCFPICFDQGASSYMVAKTYISNKIQWCNGNASPVDRDTTVTKVEIRAYSTSMNSCGTLTAYLRPVFTTGDGDTRSWIPPGYTLYYVPPEWSGWFDITNDTNAPATWTWEEVNNLGVDHWMVRTECTDLNHLDTARIEVRITWYDSVTLTGLLEDSLDNKLNKQLKQFNLWEDYKLHDEGIAGQPLNFEGIEVGVAVGAKTAAQVAQEKFTKIHSWIENNYNVVLIEFGDCFNAEYAIKDFAIQSMKHSSNYMWRLSLEKAGN